MGRPKELTYALDERPPWIHLVGLGLQHVAVICPFLVMVALVVEAAKLPHEAARSSIGLAMIAVAFMTVLQSLRLGAVGSGYLCPPVVSAIYLPSSLAVASSFGVAGVLGMTIFAGICEKRSRRSSIGPESYFLRSFPVSSSWRSDLSSAGSALASCSLIWRNLATKP
jgi:xanthine permease XanP